MSDPQLIQDRLATAKDAFEFATGTPTFEPGLNAGIDAESGEVQIQKACRLLDVSGRMDALGEYYGAVLEQSFIAIEQTFSGYLLAVTGTEEHDLRDHRSPYELATGQVPSRMERSAPSTRCSSNVETSTTTGHRLPLVSRRTHCATWPRRFTTTS